jgi:tetratricopeptide (TPR) repeat protein
MSQRPGSSSNGPVSPLWLSFLALWALTQLVFGAVRPWAVAAAAATLALLNLAAMLLLPGPLRLSRAALVFLSACAALFLLHLLPGPSFLFPVTASLREAHGVAGPWPATADASLTVYALAQVSIYVLTALLVVRLRQAGLPSATALKGLCAVLVAQGLYALAQVSFGFQGIPFFGARVYGDAASGTLVNRNSFAGLMGMGLAVATGLAFRDFVEANRRVDLGRSAASWNRRVEKGLMWGLAVALFIACIVLSKSRAGACAAFTALLVVPLLSGGGSATLGVTALAVLGAGAMLVAQPEALFERLLQTERTGGFEGDIRWTLWRSTLEGAARQPFLGFGVGTHPQAYHPFQPVEVSGQVQHAHNEYVNVLFEGGAAWLVILLGGLAAWYVRAGARLRTLVGTDRVPVAAAIAGVTVLALHSLADFDLRITSVGMLFAALVGMAAPSSGEGRETARAAWGSAAAAGLLSAAAMAWLPLDAGRALEGEESCRRALALSPCDYRPALGLARLAHRQGDAAVAAQRFFTAAELWPAHVELQQEAGLYLWEVSAKAGSTARREQAQRCLQRLFDRRPASVGAVVEELWLAGASIGELEALVPGRPLGMAELAGFLARKGRWEEAMQVFQRGCPPEAANAAAYDAFAGALEQSGQWGLEAQVREKRLEVKSDAGGYAAAARAWGRLGVVERAVERASMAAQIEPMRSAWHALHADQLRAKGDLEGAREALSRAIRWASRDASLYVRRGRLFLQMESPAMAEADFRSALRERPGLRDAELGLARALVAGRKGPEARKVLERLLERRPGDAEAERLLLGLPK